MGIFGAGNSGAAVTKFVAPAIVGVRLGDGAEGAAAAMLVTALAFWMLSYTDPAHQQARKRNMREELAVLKDPNVWKLSQCYSICSAAMSGCRLDDQVLRRRVRLRAPIGGAARRVLLAAGRRAARHRRLDVRQVGAHPVTWWVMLISFVCLFFLSYPQTDLVVRTTKGRAVPLRARRLRLPTLMFVMGIAWAVGKALGVQVHLG